MHISDLFWEVIAAVKLHPGNHKTEWDVSKYLLKYKE